MKLNKNAKLLLQANCEAVIRGQDKSGFSGRWPMPVLKTTNEASIYSEPILAQVFYKIVKKIEKEHKVLSELTRALSYPSPLARLTMIFRSRKLWPLTKDEQVDMYNILADILAPSYIQDKFCLYGKNILLAKEKLKLLVSHLNKADKFKIPISLISKLDGRLWLYTEMIYSRWHNLGHEFHGPYGVSEKLLIKEWHDLRGPGWAVSRKFPYEKITCYEFYRNNAIFIDLHNRFVSVKPLAQSLTRCYVEINGKLVTEDKALKLIETLDDYLARGAQYLASRNKTQLKKMNAVMEFYSIKSLVDILRISWRPPRKLLASIERGKLSTEAKELLKKLGYYYSYMNDQRIVNIQFNPSVDFK